MVVTNADGPQMLTDRRGCISTRMAKYTFDTLSGVLLTEGRLPFTKCTKRSVGSLGPASTAIRPGCVAFR
jgi:hypothetical protein